MKQETYYSSYCGTVEVIDIIEEHNLPFSLGSVLKYLMRAGLKTKEKNKDYRKAKDFLLRELSSEKVHQELATGRDWKEVSGLWPGISSRSRVVLPYVFDIFFLDPRSTMYLSDKALLIEKAINLLEAGRH